MKPEHYERKRQFLVTLPPTVARWLQIYGDSNLSTGILELVRHATDVDALYPEYLKQAHPRRTTLMAHDPHEKRKRDADAVANWSGRQTGNVPEPSGIETEPERFERIKQNTLTAARAQAAAREELRQQEDAQRLEKLENDAFAKSLAAFEAGEPLPDHKELNHAALREVRARVFARCKIEIGWEHGPKPPPLPPPQWQPGEPTPGVPDLTEAELAAARAEEEEFLAEQGRRRATPASPGPLTEQEATEVAAPLHESPESSMQQEEPAASIATQDAAEEGGAVAIDDVSEPTF